LVYTAPREETFALSDLLQSRYPTATIPFLSVRGFQLNDPILPEVHPDPGSKRSRFGLERQRTGARRL
jgi:hypothetical protein